SVACFVKHSVACFAGGYERRDHANYSVSNTLKRFHRHGGQHGSEGFRGAASGVARSDWVESKGARGQDGSESACCGQLGTRRARTPLVKGRIARQGPRG